MGRGSDLVRTFVPKLTDRCSCSSFASNLEEVANDCSLSRLSLPTLNGIINGSFQAMMGWWPSVAKWDNNMFAPPPSFQLFICFNG